MKSILFLLILLSSSLLFAAGAGHEGGVPTNLIIYQTINVTLIVIGLIYFLKEPVRKTFKDRHSQYIAAAQKAEIERKHAELALKEVKEKLENLNKTEMESISRARAEASDLKMQIIKEAEISSQKIKMEASESAKHEFAKAKKEIRNSMIIEAIKLSKNQIEQQVSSDDHQRLQQQFIQNIQVVQQ